jgi:hypothetical protein
VKALETGYRRPGDQETRRPGDQETRRPGPETGINCLILDSETFLVGIDASISRKRKGLITQY